MCTAAQGLKHSLLDWIFLILLNFIFVWACHVWLRHKYWSVVSINMQVYSTMIYFVMVCQPRNCCFSNFIFNGDVIVSNTTHCMLVCNRILGSINFEWFSHQGVHDSLSFFFPSFQRCVVGFFFLISIISLLMLPSWKFSYCDSAMLKSLYTRITFNS